MFTEVSEGRTVSIFRVEELFAFFRNVYRYLRHRLEIYKIYTILDQFPYFHPTLHEPQQQKMPYIEAF
jgi:hypothetical protein